MRRDQLEHGIRAACQIAGVEEVIVIGSQAILGTYPEYDLPDAATSSAEVDILPSGVDHATTVALAEKISAVAGDLSMFEQQHGFSLDGVDMTTAAVPDGWRDRLVKVQNRNTAAASGHPQYVGWCLDKEDLCVTKLIAHRPKDLNFVAALLTAGLADPAVIAERLPTVDDRFATSVAPALSWLEYQIRQSGS
ncbi:hypothetical protein EB74_27575 [Mycobacterium sp. SWH-M5]|nr:hypothetical protein EB74_27575 [Mycobacterium sp. SWH-M5]